MRLRWLPDGDDMPPSSDTQALTFTPNDMTVCQPVYPEEVAEIHLSQNYFVKMQKKSFASISYPPPCVHATLAIRVMEPKGYKLTIPHFQELQLFEKLRDKSSPFLMRPYSVMPVDLNEYHINMPALECNLRDLVRKNHFKRNDLAKKVNDLAKKVCHHDVGSGIMFLHNLGYYHFDVKPRNILCRKISPTQYRFVLGDTGLVCSKSFKLHREQGTPMFICPLELRDVAVRGYVTDAYAFLVTLMYVELQDYPWKDPFFTVKEGRIERNEAVPWDSSHTFYKLCEQAKNLNLHKGPLERAGVYKDEVLTLLRDHILPYVYFPSP